MQLIIENFAALVFKSLPNNPVIKNGLITGYHCGVGQAANLCSELF